MYSQPTPYPYTLIHSILKSDHASSFIMIGSPVAASKRSGIKQVQSGGMGWPRLVPVKDQQPQKPTHNEPSQIHRSSASPSLQDPNEQAIPPTAVEKPTPEDRPLSLFTALLAVPTQQKNLARRSSNARTHSKIPTLSRRWNTRTLQSLRRWLRSDCQ